MAQQQTRLEFICVTQGGYVPLVVAGTHYANLAFFFSAAADRFQARA